MLGVHPSPGLFFGNAVPGHNPAQALFIGHRHCQNLLAKAVCPGLEEQRRVNDHCPGSGGKTRFHLDLGLPENPRVGDAIEALGLFRGSKSPLGQQLPVQNPLPENVRAKFFLERFPARGAGIGNLPGNAVAVHNAAA